jgi:hypothetical protein
MFVVSLLRIGSLTRRSAVGSASTWPASRRGSTGIATIPTRAFGVEDRLASPRLFDPDLYRPVKSQFETPKCPSQIETPPPLSEIETDNPEVEDSAYQLQVVAEEATMVVNAHDRLEAAIQAARRAGVSWRQIGIAAGVPYQTLHRRHRQGGRT